LTLQKKESQIFVVVYISYFVLFSYVGRKILEGEQEELVGGASRLVTPRYSYWTLGYLISLRGVHKLLDAQPLANLLPVDEFLPIMFDVHPR